jgi:calcium-dependent protein kinase
MNEEEYLLMEQGEGENGECEEIKVKWNSFIKMKKRNYLDDYVIMKEIGRGGFGKVNKVRSKYTGLYRAAKKIKKSTLGKQEHEKLFIEMAIMKSLDHINIIRLYEVYDYKSHYVLILELCEGGELFKKIITSKELPEDYIARIVKQILKVLLYLQHVGVVHRDLKPENMLFERNSQIVKIIDFGIAHQKQDQEKLTERVGTPYYVAPEVLLKKYDEKCDVWSTGVIFYMMLTHRPPFRGDNEVEVMQRILGS